MELKKIKLTDIHEAEYNPRVMTESEMNKLENSLNEFGMVDPIIINLKNNKIIGGHQRYKAILNKYYEEGEFNPELNLIRLGDVGWCFTDTDVTIKDENHEKALNLALNKISGDWDNEKLNNIIEELSTEGFNIDLTGFTELEINDLIEAENTYKNITDDNYDPPQEMETNIKQGDIFKLGNHYLMCGDSTNEEDIKKLLNNNTKDEPVKIDSLVTDPPYGVDYASKNELLNKIDKGNRVQTPILNDNIEDYESFFNKILNNIKPYFNDYNTYYIFMSTTKLNDLINSLNNTDYYFSELLVWVKNNHVLGRLDYAAKHEFCLYGWYNHHKFYGDFSTTILEFPKPSTSKLHPTMKPIELISKLITDGSPGGGIILDLFGGSGTTLIACEQLNRKCYMIELDPHYCQVIIDRWEEYSGQTAEKIV
jgi:DNA modification methylase